METIHITSNTPIKIDEGTLKKMMFIQNALETGWSVKKRDSSYVFTKKHEGRKEVLKESYLKNFIKTNFDLNL